MLAGLQLKKKKKTHPKWGQWAHLSRFPRTQDEVWKKRKKRKKSEMYVDSSRAAAWARERRERRRGRADAE